MAVVDRDWRWKQQLYDANAHRVDDLELDHMKGLDAVLEADDWDIFLIGGIVTSYNYIKHAVKRARRVRPNCRIIVGGGFFSALPYDLMRLMPEIDYGVIGEAYRTLPELVDALEHGKNVDVPGIAARENDQIRFTAPREIIPDLDWLPFPKYEYAPLEIYFRNSADLLSEEAYFSRKRIDLLGSLGCGFLCQFCWDLGITTTPKYLKAEDHIEVKGGRPLPTVMRYHSPKYLADLIEHCRNSFRKIEYELEDGTWVGAGYPVDFFAWLDENLQTSIAKTKGKWFADLKEELEKRNLIPKCVREGFPHDPDKCDGPHMGGTGHAGLCRPEYLKTLREIGFSYLDYGLETWDRRILRWLGKGSTVERNAQAIFETLEAGIRPIPNQIIGFPQEDWESIKAMVDAWEKYGIVTVPFIMTAYPGSEIFETNRKLVLDQYGGDMDAFLSDLEDATKVTAVLCKNFTSMELAGIQAILGQAAKSRDFKNLRRLLALSEHEWRRMRGLPPDEGAFREYLYRDTRTVKETAK